MKNQLGICSAVAAVLMLTGCETFHSNLTVHESLTIKDAHGLLHRTVTFPAGQYSAEFKIHPTRRLLEIKADDKHDAYIKLPIGNLEHDGPFHFSAHQLEQDFDADGNLTTRVEVGQSRPGTQSCIAGYYTTYIISNGILWPVQQAIYGSQNIMWHPETTTRTIQISIERPNTHSTLATVEGDDVNTAQIIDSSGPCY